MTASELRFLLFKKNQNTKRKINFSKKFIIPQELRNLGPPKGDNFRDKNYK